MRNHGWKGGLENGNSSNPAYGIQVNGQHAFMAFCVVDSGCFGWMKNWQSFCTMYEPKLSTTNSWQKGVLRGGLWMLWMDEKLAVFLYDVRT